MNLHVLRVSTTFPPVIDGRAFHVVGLSREQTRRGYRVTVFQPNVVENGDAYPFEIEHVHVRKALGSPLHSKAARLSFGYSAGKGINRVAQQRTALIHLHGDVMELAACRAVLRADLPIVMTLHSGLNERRRYRIVARQTLPLARRVIAVSEAIKDQVVSLGVSEKRIDVISSGTDPARFDLQPSARSPTDALRIICVGRLVEMKGLEFAIDAVKTLPSGTVHLTVVGKGPDGDRLRRKAAGHPGISLVGDRDFTEIPRILVDSDVFLMPSVRLEKEAEGTPTAVIEAVSAGLPVICTETSGANSLIKDGTNGFVVPERDPAAIASALLRLKHDPAMRREMAVANKNVAERFSWRAIAQRVEAVYEGALVDQP